MATLTKSKQTAIVYDYMRVVMASMQDSDFDPVRADSLKNEANEFIQRHGFDIKPVHNGYYLISKVLGYPVSKITDIRSQFVEAQE